MNDFKEVNALQVEGAVLIGSWDLPLMDYGVVPDKKSVPPLSMPSTA